MKKIILTLIGILALLTSNAQTTKDTVILDGEKIGYIDCIDSIQGFKGSLTTFYNINLFRDLLADEKYALVNMYTIFTRDLLDTGTHDDAYKPIQQEGGYYIYKPIDKTNIEVNLNYEYYFKTNSAKAGHLLFEAGKLNTQSKNIYLASSVVILYSILHSEVNTNPLAILAVSSSGIMSIVALAKSYKADKKIKEAGILLQKTSTQPQ